MVLVRERGNAMAEAAATTPTGMTAVLGGDRDEVLAALEAQGLTPANDNGPGQIVAAGTMEQLQALADNPPAKARLIPLSVAGAFHTEHMAPAVGHLATLARSVSTHDPRTPLISNRDGQIVHDGREVVARIVGQIARPGALGPLHGDHDRPRRHRAARDAAGRHPDRHRQARPARGRDLRAQDPRPARRRPRVLRQARRGLDDRHHAHLADGRLADEGHVPPLRRGRRRPTCSRPARPSATSPARATAPRSRAAHGGQVVEWLVEDGDLVSPGQPLVRLHPEGAA